MVPPVEVEGGGVAEHFVPPVYTNLKLAQWEVVVTYQQGNALVIANVDGVVSTVQDVYSYQHRQTDLVALTSKSLLIIDSSSCIPIALPETLFQPTKLILNQSMVCCSTQRDSTIQYLGCSFRLLSRTV